MNTFKSKSIFFGCFASPSLVGYFSVGNCHQFFDLHENILPLESVLDLWGFSILLVLAVLSGFVTEKFSVKKALPYVACLS